MSLERTNPRFDTTNWSLIDDLRSDSESRRDAALQLLATTYWPPVYAFYRLSGMNRDRAAEITQAFFSDVVLGRGLFERADADKARLRTLIRASLKRYQIDQYRRGVVRGAGITVPISHLEQEDQHLPADGAALDAFDRRWASAVLEEAMRRCQRHYADGERVHLWAAFQTYTVQPIISGGTPPPLTEVAATHGFETPARLASALQGVRKRLTTLLREIVSETVTDADEAEPELRTLVDLLGVGE